jgi:hypothetical protein
MKRNRRRKSDGLHSRVVRYTLRNDNIGNGDYIGYCELSHYKGIVLNDSVCRKRECKHYLKLYIGCRGRLEGFE